MTLSKRITGAMALAFLFTALLLPQAFAAKDKRSKTKPATENTAPTAVTAPQAPSVPSDKIIGLDPTIRYGTLPNGMKYYIKENRKPENRVEMRLAVNAGANQAVQAGQTVTLDGSKSTDPNNDPLTYAWTLTKPAGSAATLSSSCWPSRAE